MPGTHRLGDHSPEAWQNLQDDLYAADHVIDEQRKNLANQWAEINRLQQQLGFERWVRGLQDDLIVRLVLVRDHASAHAHYAYEQLRRTEEQLQRAREVTEDLRRRNSGVTPDPRVVGPELAHS